MCHTLNVEESFRNNRIHLYLNINLTFIVFVHDPTYFIYSMNPTAIPMTTRVISRKKTFFEVSLVEREHTELNVPADPCEESPDYSFTRCVKSSLARSVGCRTKWGMRDDKTLPLCTTLQQFR